jgi:hypothetical protein
MKSPAATVTEPVSRQPVSAGSGSPPVGGRATGGNEPGGQPGAEGTGGAAGGGAAGGAGGASGGGAAGGATGGAQVLTLAPPTSFKSAVSSGCAERLVKRRLL